MSRSNEIDSIRNKAGRTLLGATLVVGSLTTAGVVAGRTAYVKALESENGQSRHAETTRYTPQKDELVSPKDGKKIPLNGIEYLNGDIFKVLSVDGNTVDLELVARPSIHVTADIDLIQSAITTSP
ncbi:MAG TPA: hypothetical protein VFG51_03080 [Candidatus Saccharimonadia bacterium]|nr:hypothetical protein [Candidatus Saccharimonadia bacterium]